MYSGRVEIRFYTLLLALVLVLSIALPSAAGSADMDIAPPEMVNIVAATLNLYDSDNTEIIQPYEDVPQDAHFDISVDFEIDSEWEQENDILDGTSFTLTLPSALTNVAAFTYKTGELKDDADNTYANFTITTTGEIVVVFNGYVEEEQLSDIAGTIELSGFFHEDILGTGETISFSLTASATYNITFEDDPVLPTNPTTIDKSGIYEETTGQIVWSVTVSPGDYSLDNATIVDTLGMNHEMIASSFNMDGASLDYDADSENYIFSLGSITEETTFTYRTKPADSAFTSVNEGGQVAFLNEAVLFNNDDELDDADATVNVAADFIEKTGVFYVNSGGQPYILWTVTVNNNSLFMPQPFTVRDTLPDYLTMSESSLTVDGLSQTFAVEDKTYSYTFASDITAPVALSYITYIDEAYYRQQDKASFTNTASVIYNTKTYSDTVNVPVGTSLIRKTGMGYDREFQLITWRMIINENNKEITNAVVTDSILAGQELIEDSIVISKSGAISHYDDGTRQLTIHLGDVADTEEPVITYQTYIPNKAHTATNNSGVNYYNTAILAGDNIATATSIASQSVSSQVLVKSGTYNYASHQLNWTVAVNGNSMTMTSLVVTDTIADGQYFVPQSMQVNGVDFEPQGNEADNTLTIDLGDIDETAIITFATQLTEDELAKYLDKNENRSFRNDVSLSSDFGQSVSAFETVTVNNQSLAKSVKTTYNEEEGTIEWEVKCNPHQVLLDNAILHDQLQDGLVLDAESIRLYEWNIDSSGNMSQGELVAGSEYSFEYAYVTREFMFRLPQKAQGYLLLFKTDVEKPGSYTNSISMLYSNQLSSNSGSAVVVTDVSGSISGKNGSITVRKVGSDTNLPITTGGATFELLDSKGIVNAEAVTDSNGEASFTKLKLRSYSIREKIAPLGYALNSAVYQVTLSSASPTGTVVVGNLPLTASITLKKISKSGKLLSGGTFSIYSAEDTKTPIQQIESVDGSIVFSGLKAGEYVIAETKAPSGYKRTSEVRTAELILNTSDNTLPDVVITDPLINYPRPDNDTVSVPAPKPGTGTIEVTYEDGQSGIVIDIYD